MRIFIPTLIAFACLAIAFQLPAKATFASPQNDPFGDSNDAMPHSKDRDAEKQKPEELTIELGDADAVKSVDEIVELLNQPISMNFQKASFAEISQSLGEQIDVNILLDMSAKDDMLTDDETISFSIKNARLATAMSLMLKDWNACLLIEDGVIRVISKDLAGDPDFFRRKVFDCRELLVAVAENAEKFPDHPLNRLHPGGFGGGGGLGDDGRGGSSGGGVFNHPDSPQGAQGFGGLGGGGRQLIEGKTYPSDLLVQCIKNTVTPDEWDDTNGDATISPIGGVLVVSGSERQLEKIEKLLEQLNSKLTKE